MLRGLLGLQTSDTAGGGDGHGGERLLGLAHRAAGGCGARRKRLTAGRGDVGSHEQEVDAVARLVDAL